MNLGGYIHMKSIRTRLLVLAVLALTPVLAVEFWRGRAGADTVIAAIAGLILAGIAASSVALAARRLTHAANAISVGDYRKRVSVRTGDELQVLSDSLNALGESLSRREGQVRAQAEMLARMVEAARVASSSLDIDECAAAIAKVLCTQLGASEAGVFLKQTDGREVKPVGSFGSGHGSSWQRLAAHSTSSGEYIPTSEHQPADGSCEGPGAVLVGIPLMGGAGPIGAMVARFEPGLSRSDLRLGSARADVMIAFGVHAAAALRNAQVYSRAEKYSGLLEDWLEHLTSLMKVTDAISPSLTLNETLEALAREAAGAMSADQCVIYVPDEAGRLVVGGYHGPARSVVAQSRLKPGDGISGRAYADKRSVWCVDAAEADDPSAGNCAAMNNMRGVLSTPLIVEDTAIGAITVYDRQPRRFTAKEIRLLSSIGLHASVVVRNAGLYTKQVSIAETLQKGLISEAPDEYHGVKFAGRYLPALDEARVGGDFYDVLKLPDGRLAVVMGDVSGKGLEAAIHLAACKYMTRAFIYAYPGNPAQVLHALNEAVSSCFDSSFFMTMFYGVVDPSEGTITYASAGHPPALLITQESRMQSDLGSTGIPVGIGIRCDYGMRKVVVAPSDVLLLYTDGVIDALKDGSALGVEGLHSLVFEAGRRPISEIVGFITEQLAQGRARSRRDDMALLAVSFEGVDKPARSDSGGTDVYSCDLTARSR